MRKKWANRFLSKVLKYKFLCFVPFLPVKKKIKIIMIIIIISKNVKASFLSASAALRGF